MKFAIYILVVEDTNEAAELLAGVGLPIGVSTVESITEIGNESDAVAVAVDIAEVGRLQVSRS